MDEIETLAETIIYFAQERQKAGKCQNLNSAICAIGLEVDQLLMTFMKEHKEC